VRRARRLAPLALVLALVMPLTACGSKDNGGVITPSETPTSSTTGP